MFNYKIAFILYQIIIFLIVKFNLISLFFSNVIFEIVFTFIFMIFFLVSMYKIYSLSSYKNEYFKKWVFIFIIVFELGIVITSIK